MFNHGVIIRDGIDLDRYDQQQDYQQRQNLILKKENRHTVLTVRLECFSVPQNLILELLRRDTPESDQGSRVSHQSADYEYALYHNEEIMRIKLKTVGGHLKDQVQPGFEQLRRLLTVFPAGRLGTALSYRAMRFC